jgi:hypothetical protein
MSEEPTIQISNEEPSAEQKLKWLNEWKEKVQQEISDYTSERDKIFAVYKKQKEMYDGWLNKKMKKIKKYDVVMNNRKKVLMDIDKEITNLSNTKN